MYAIDSCTGLVLEGGGMRCAFTAGALDYFMDRELWFPYTIGVSAGASNGISYISRQRGRSLYSYTELMRIYKYIGLRSFLCGRGIIDMDFIFNVFVYQYYPFDFSQYFNHKGRFVMVATNCLTGQAEYYEEKDNKERLLSIVRASCSLPVLCPKGSIDGIPMVDGGVCDSIPIRRSIADGNNKHVVILTRNKGYRKKDKDFYLPGFIYSHYPALRERLKYRYKNYNEQLDYVEELERKGEAIVIRPISKLEVGRTERNINKLEALYNEGYACARQILEAL